MKTPPTRKKHFGVPGNGRLTPPVSSPRVLDELGQVFDASLRNKAYLTGAEMVEIIMRVNQQWVKALLRGGSTANAPRDISLETVQRVQQHVREGLKGFEGRQHGPKMKALREWLAGMVKEIDSGKLPAPIKGSSVKQQAPPASVYSGLPL